MAAEEFAGQARTEIIRKIRAAAGGAANEKSALAGWSAIERKYRRGAGLPPEAILELLVDRLEDYDARVIRVEQAGVRAAAAKFLADRFQDRKAKRMVVPSGLAQEWLPAGIEFLIDNQLPAAELDAVDGVMTGATLAIAETGTVVLQNVEGLGRRAVTLVPDYHLCIVKVEDVVETVPEAFVRLQKTATLATTFVSGPSATADIEMTRIKGVHGPRFLDVILAG
ncbi:MAG TPA: LUD domain-containing protein [Edaphobacter sp.]|jgi:L-lactate dehydrogenase complex protein LldG|nr:LUD domain-containing protein [Edaphobacter sp.]